MAKLKNTHPGDVLLYDFMNPMGISQKKLAQNILISPHHIDQIILGKHPITADMALRLSRYFGTHEKFWLGLQNDHDLEKGKNKLSPLA